MMIWKAALIIGSVNGSVNAAMPGELPIRRYGGKNPMSPRFPDGYIRGPTNDAFNALAREVKDARRHSLAQFNLIEHFLKAVYPEKEHEEVKRLIENNDKLTMARLGHYVANFELGMDDHTNIVERVDSLDEYAETSGDRTKWNFFTDSACMIDIVKPTIPLPDEVYSHHGTPTDHSGKKFMRVIDPKELALYGESKYTYFPFELVKMLKKKERKAQKALDKESFLRRRNRGMIPVVNDTTPKRMIPTTPKWILPTTPKWMIPMKWINW